MRIAKALLGALVWILACVVALLGIVLSATLILLPLGIPLLVLSGRLFGKSVALVLPRAVTHPGEELGKSAKKKGRAVKEDAPTPDPAAAKKKLLPFFRRRKKKPV
ncbi:hypothetical protein [Nocardioides mesophilus]|uniref:YccF domain-containing protein n=1 Tax=Nocardioides mesophilus TaxID=433659 RepID=A0A7G9RHY4_9ACTN|nr:hypothetical protein [Nocardioides mesophilus]QNN55209.1 hypothetical protein H9L09_13770 [Nocardioides mesophilus]